MEYSVNNTKSYHINEMDTLGWELTVCNSLEPENNPCRSVLLKNTTFGNHLFDYLTGLIDFKKITSFLEVGGGYGFLMRDFLHKNPDFQADMIDISPYLLQKQKEQLMNYNVKFLNSDFFTIEKEYLQKFDFAIFNENIGDFSTICNLSPEIFNPHNENKKDIIIHRICELFDMYSLEKKNIDNNFNFNLGAVEALEKICSAGISYIYMSEHSCEATVPDEYKNKILIKPSGNPEKIKLKGHDEYTVKFSYLEKVASSFGYTVIRGQFADFIQFDNSGKLNFILTSNSQKDEHEIIRQFVYDLFKYEFLVLMKPQKN